MSRINVDFTALADVEGRFARLAQLLGLADADHARGKVEHLWAACTTRGETDLPAWLVEQRLGERGPAALIESGLGRWGAGRGDSKTRRVHIAGSAERCLWLRHNQVQAPKGGKARAAKATRDHGKFARVAGETQPAQLPAETSAPAPAPAPAPDQNPSLLRAIPPAVPGPGAQARPGTEYDPAAPRDRGQLAERIYQRVSDARLAIAAELKLPEQLPFPPITPATRPRAFVELLDRVREEGAAAPAACDRVVANLLAQARETRDVEWLSQKAFSAGAWTTARERVPGAKRARADRGAALAPRPDPGPPAVTVPEAERAAAAASVGEHQALLAQLLADGARAPPTSSTAITDEQQPQPQARKPA